jgi:hypothetical protein
MRTKSRLHLLEARLNELEARADQFRERPERSEHTVHIGHSDYLSALDDLRTAISRQLAIQADRLAALNLKLEMTHSRVERLDRIQDEIHQTQEEHTAVLAEILEAMPTQESVT